MKFNLDMWYHAAENNWFSTNGLIYPGVLIFVLFWIFAFGACIGSFLNVCIWRIPRNESLSKKSSHCTSCGAEIRWFDNIPVISYLVLRGKCRACRQSYSSSYFWVELICAILVTMVFVKTGLCGQSMEIIPARMLVVFFGVTCAMTDLRFRVVPDKLTMTGMIMALVLAWLLPAAWGVQDNTTALLYALASGLVPGWLLFCFAEIGRWIAGKEVIGMGDVKFITMCGFLIGFPGAVFVLFAGSLLGSLWGVAVKRDFKAQLPFVPFLTLAALVWIFFDRQILSFYSGLFV